MKKENIIIVSLFIVELVFLGLGIYFFNKACNFEIDTFVPAGIFYVLNLIVLGIIIAMPKQMDIKK